MNVHSIDEIIVSLKHLPVQMEYEHQKKLELEQRSEQRVERGRRSKKQESRELRAEMKEMASAAENAMKIEWGDVKTESSRGRKSATTSEQPRTKTSVKTTSINKDMLERERLALEMAEKVSATRDIILSSLSGKKSWKILE